MQDTMTTGTTDTDLPRGGDFASEIATLETQFDIIRYMRRITQIFGFKTFLICSIPPFDVERLWRNHGHFEYAGRAAQQI